MTDYIVIADPEVEPEAPIISSLGVRFRDNAIAIAEGSDGAPRIAWRALEHLFVGSIALAEGATGVNNLAQAEHITLLGAFVATSASDIEARYSNNNGSSYGSWQTLFNAGTGDDSAFVAQLNLRTGAWATAVPSVGDSGSGTHTVPADANAFQVRTGSPNVTGRLMVLVTGGVHP